MITVMLVDDEPLILEGLKNIIPWEQYGFNVLDTCRSGKQAMESFERNPVDLIITDINMPEINGLDLIEKLNTCTKFIVLSGYQDFNYVKKGLALGIDNYLLKPIDEQELIDSLFQVKDKIKRESYEKQATLVVRDNCLSKWLMGTMDYQTCQEQMQRFPDVSLFSIERLGLIRAKWGESKVEQLKRIHDYMEKDLDVPCIQMHSGDLVLLFNKRHGLEWEDTLQKVNAFLRNQLSGIPSLWAYSNVFSNIHESQHIFRDLEIAAELKTVLPEKTYGAVNEIYFHEMASSNYASQFNCRDAIEKLSEGEIDSVKEEFIQFFHKLDEEEQFFMVKSVLFELCFQLKNRFFTSYDQEQYSLNLHRILYIKTIQEAVECMHQNIDFYTQDIHKGSKSFSPVIQSVVKYIHQNYSEEMSLKTLGDQFYTNSVYLGQLFQKEVQCSFTTYLNKVRIEHAKNLLLNSHEKAGKIGTKVGYIDQAYFFKQFKKYESMTPVKWRKQYKKNL